MGKKITKIEPIAVKSNCLAHDSKKVCAYCRVSTASGEQKNSYEAQIRYYTKLISEKDNWIMAGIYADQARSGTKVEHREQFQQMIQDCQNGKIDLILTKSVTRFARNTVDSISTIRMLKSIGVEVYFEKEKISTFSEKSEQMLTILSSIAQCESENISANNKWAVRKRFLDGTYKISCPAYGYKYNEFGELAIVPEEANIVRRIFDEYLGGKGSYIIAKELQEEKVPVIRMAHKWHDTVIKEILQNPIYEGDILYQKTYRTDCVPFNQKMNKGQLPMYLVKDNHEPIISREEGAAVRALYEYRRQKQCNKNKMVYQNRYVFSGKIKCGQCGKTFRRQKIYIGKPYEKIQWCCSQHISDITKCSQKAISEERIHKAFVNLWNRLAPNAEKILMPLLSVLKAVPDDNHIETELIIIENKIQELKRQSQMLRKVLSDGGIGSAIFIEKRNKIDCQIEVAYRRQKVLREEVAFKNEIAQTEYLLSVFRVRAKWIEIFDEELFQLTVENIVVYDQKICFRLKNGLVLEELEKEI